MSEFTSIDEASAQLLNGNLITPTQTSSPLPTTGTSNEVPSPTYSPSVTRSPSPTTTPSPTNTPLPAFTPTPISTQTPIVTPTQQLVPTSPPTPVPTASPQVTPSTPINPFPNQNPSADPTPSPTAACRKATQNTLGPPACPPGIPAVGGSGSLNFACCAYGPEEFHCSVEGGAPNLYGNLPGICFPEPTPTPAKSNCNAQTVNLFGAPICEDGTGAVTRSCCQVISSESSPEGAPEQFACIPFGTALPLPLNIAPVCYSPTPTSTPTPTPTPTVSCNSVTPTTGVEITKTSIEEASVEEKGANVLKNKCNECHHSGFDKNIGPSDITNQAAMISQKQIMPGNSADSPIWNAVIGDTPSMPQGTRPKLTEEERKDLKAWIDGGYKLAPRTTGIAERKVLERIYAHVAKNLKDAPYLRYFTFHNIASRAGSDQYTLRLFRGALSKVLNHLSWQKEIVLPQAIDKEELIYVIDLRKLWPNDGQWRWEWLTEFYPHEEVKYFSRCAEGTEMHPWGFDSYGYALQQRTYAKVPYVRADWFMVTATKPKFYKRLLEIQDLYPLPNNTPELEHLLGFDYDQSWLCTSPGEYYDDYCQQLQYSSYSSYKPQSVVRSGVSPSGVSKSPRDIDNICMDYSRGGVVDYYKSQDFKERTANIEKKNLSLFPLGPDRVGDREFGPNSIYVANRQQHSLAFNEDGGEIIFSLPNGLQGYFLEDANQRAVDVVPGDVAQDYNLTDGHGEVDNGIDCITCHQNGMNSFNESGDTVFRAAQNLREFQPNFYNGRPLQKLTALYRNELMQKRIANRRYNFFAALEKAIRPFIGGEQPIDKLPEPLLFVAKQYYRDMYLSDFAAETGIETEKLKTLIEWSSDLKDRAMGSIASGGGDSRYLFEDTNRHAIFAMLAAQRACGAWKARSADPKANSSEITSPSSSGGMSSEIPQGPSYPVDGYPNDETDGYPGNFEIP